MTGCAAPGSAITQLHVRGQIIDDKGQPAARETIVLMRPAAYGLAGLDAKWGKAEDYGHRDNVVSVKTDEDGKFEQAFAPNTYSVTFWILPPLGGFPRKPPYPFFCLRTPKQTNDFWSLWMKDSGLETRAIERGNRIPQVQSLAEPADFSGELIWEDKRTPKGYLVDFQMKMRPREEGSQPEGGVYVLPVAADLSAHP